MPKKKDKKKKPAIKHKPLKPDQELFCVLYCTPGDTFGNATRSYIKAYEVELPYQGLDVKNMNPEMRDRIRAAIHVAEQNASRTLRNVEILKRCQELTAKLLNDATADSELAYTYTQRDDLRAKVAAIKEFNQLKGRVKNQLEHLGEVKFTFTRKKA